MHTGQKITAIIQARMQSSRLPGKSMMDLAGRPLLAHVIERALLIKGVDTVVVATCGGEENNAITGLAESMGVRSYTGSVDNVLERFYTAAEIVGGDLLIRITADNPFTDHEYASSILEHALKKNADLCAYSGLPLGTAVEIIKRSALEKAYRHSTEAHQREHVTPYIKEHPDDFNIERPSADVSNPFPNVRLTVDTREDYELARQIYTNLYSGKQFNLKEILAYLHRNPELVKINMNVRQRPMTSTGSSDVR